MSSTPHSGRTSPTRRCGRAQRSGRTHRTDRASHAAIFIVLGTLVALVTIAPGSLADVREANWSTDFGPLGCDNSVNDMIVYNGKLIATGYFTQAGHIVANGIAEWDGITWCPLGEGINGVGLVLALFNGDLMVGGQFDMAGGSPANNIARWDGTNWHNLGSGTDANV